MIGSFEKLSDILKKSSGIVLDPDKQYLVESRLLPIARGHGHDRIAPLVDKLLETREPALVQDVVDALATNETFFFRDRAPFDQFASVMLPYLMRARTAERAIHIWCNACSTGQEPYSLAMSVDQMAAQLGGWRINLQATDISRGAIEAARVGRFNQFEVQRGLPANMLLRYFNRDGDQWRVAEHLRSMVRYSNFNLLKSFEDRGPYDVIFCRNVLIYFDQWTRRDILGRLAGVLRKDGFLVLGSTETILQGEDGWVRAPENPMLYVRADGPHALAKTA